MITDEEVQTLSEEAIQTLRQERVHRRNDEARRERIAIEKIRNALRNGNLVIVTGAGFTINATLQADGTALDRTTWKGLILNGWRYLVTTPHVNESSLRMKMAREALDTWDGENLIMAASIVKEELDKQNKFSTSLRDVFEDLPDEVTNPNILEVLKVVYRNSLQRNHQVKLLTTNYDDVLDKHCGLQSIGRSPKPFQKFKLGKLDGVFHIHGCWENSEEVVLDQIGYYQIKQFDEV